MSANDVSPEVKDAVDMLCAAHEIAMRNGVDTNWTAFLAGVRSALVPFNRNGITARTYRLPNATDQRARSAPLHPLVGQTESQETKP